MPVHSGNSVDNLPLAVPVIQGSRFRLFLLFQHMADRFVKNGFVPPVVL
jgi:hypothetical protein